MATPAITPSTRLAPRLRKGSTSCRVRLARGLSPAISCMHPTEGRHVAG